MQSTIEHFYMSKLYSSFSSFQRRNHIFSSNILVTIQLQFPKLHFPGEVFFSQEVWSILSLFPSSAGIPHWQEKHLQCAGKTCDHHILQALFRKPWRGSDWWAPGPYSQPDVPQGDTGCHHTSWWPQSTCREAAVPFPATAAARALLFAEVLNWSSSSCAPLDTS